MKSNFRRIPLFLLGIAFVSAEPPGIDQTLEYVTPPTGAKFIRWHGKPGRSYFVQISDTNTPLTKWSWAPIIESGNNENISYQVDDTPNKGFFRLHYTDAPPPTGVTLEAWDADSDTLPNALEINLQANPLNPDTNGDGIPDGWAYAHGHLPTANIASGLFNGGPLTNLQAYQQGVQANPNATPDDLDGDLVDNDVDADPQDSDVDWDPASVGGYALIDLGWPVGVQPGSQNIINDFNDLGHVLLDRHVWRGGQWHPIPLEQASGSEMTEGNRLLAYKSIDNTGFRLTPSGGILHVGTWEEHQTSILGSIPCPYHIGHQTYDAATSTYGPFKSTLSTHGLMLDQGLVVPRPLGADATGRIFADKTYTYNLEPEIWIYNGDMVKTGALAVPGNFDLGFQDTEFKRATVTSSGWFAYPARSYTPPSNYDYRLLVWNPGGQIIAYSENLPSEYTGFTELPHGKPALAYGYHGTNGTVYLLNQGGTAFKTASKLGGKNIHTFAGDGTAMTSDGKMWINGKLTPLRDLCARYGELLDDDWTFNIHKANKHGVYLIQANKNQESRPHLLLPVDITIRKKGDVVPLNGVLVKTQDVMEFALAPSFFEAEDNFESLISWQFRQRKADGSYEDWVDAGGQCTGTKFECAFALAGIFQVKAVIANVGEYEYKRKKDEKIGSFEYGRGKKYEPDCVGVCNTQIQIDICREAQRFYGDTSYHLNNVVPAQYGFPEYPATGNSIIRCNIFVAHRATAVGAVVPKINGFFNEYPPLANEWAGIEDTSILPGDPTYINGWPILPSSTYPQPGWIIAHPQPGDAGHCAITDYDGEGIGAGISGTVNKRYNLSPETFWDGTSRSRKYTP